jgi:hypothetical protein
VFHRQRVELLVHQVELEKAELVGEIAWLPNVSDKQLEGSQQRFQSVLAFGFSSVKGRCEAVRALSGESQEEPASGTKALADRRGSKVAAFCHADQGEAI